MGDKRVYYFEENNLKVRPILARYKFPLPYIKEKVVLDIGCGARSGPWILSQAALHVTAIDISSEAIDYCLKKWPKDNISYIVADAINLPFSDQSFEAVVSFEVIEHMVDYQKYLSEVFRVLKRGGLCILSTPNRVIASPNGILSNPDHFREFNADELKNLLLKQFSSITLYGQRPSNCVIKAENVLSQIHASSDKVPRLLKQLLPKGLKKKIFEIFMSFWAKLKALPNPNQISEEDFIFEKDRIEKARYLLAIGRK